ncbi:MAG: hypothetical protein Q8O75_02775 [bacterium]|nr:hypothetical protein [bacterium]
MDEEELKALDKLFDKKLTPIKEDLNEIKETVDVNNASLINLENTIGVYSDALDVERKRIDKHDGRLEVIEENLDLNP